MRLPLAEAILMQLAHRALRGEVWALKEILRQMGWAERTRAVQDAAHARREVQRARNNTALRERRRLEAVRAADAARAAEAQARDEARRRPSTYEERFAYDLDIHDNAVADAMASLGLVDDGKEADGLRLLEPWVVEAARQRRPGLWWRLSEEDRAQVRTAVNGVERDLDWEAGETWEDEEEEEGEAEAEPPPPLADCPPLD